MSKSDRLFFIPSPSFLAFQSNRTQLYPLLYTPIIQDDQNFML